VADGNAGVELGFGQEVMELARCIKGPDEILAMRCAVNACETTMVEMHEALTPGMTEREVWAMLHAGNIRRGGEWIETLIISSGPRTNPWMQEASSRIVEQGVIVAYDTDLVGAYGMMVDISRTWIAGEGRGAGGSPTAEQQHTHDLACEQIHRNTELLTVGRSFRELTFDAWFPDPARYRHYSCLFHGVGQCDEYPEIYFPEIWEEWGFDGELHAGMVLTVESYVGPRSGTGSGTWAEGVKLENQVLVTDDGPELLTHLSLDMQEMHADWRHRKRQRPHAEAQGLRRFSDCEDQSADSAASSALSSSRGSGASPNPMAWKISALRKSKSS